MQTYDTPKAQTSPEMTAQMEMQTAERQAKRIVREQMRAQIQAEGQAALLRLMPVAERYTGQSGVVARFLLSLQKGQSCPFNLIELRRLDDALHDDCIAVLRMDATPYKEVHCYIQDGFQRFKRLSAYWYPNKESAQETKC